METPALYIKIKGAEAISALTKGQVVGAAKLKGGAVLAKGVLLKGAEIEGEGLIATKHGIFAAEFEGVHAGFTNGAGGVVKGAGSAAKGAAAKAGAVKAGAAKAGASAGTIWSGKGVGLGLGLGLGALGPILVLGALGLGAVGIYLYRRNKKLEAEDMSFDEDDVALPTV
jgi:hypothetical protein